MDAVTKMDGTPLDQRPLPNNIEAEQALIGALLLRNEHYAKVSFEVSADDFYEPLHREAWALMVELIEANKIALCTAVRKPSSGAPAFVPARAA